MLWNFSNSFENIQFKYRYKKKKIINPFYKNFIYTIKREKKYFYLNRKYLKPYFLQKTFNKLSKWNDLFQNYLATNTNSLKNLILKKKKYFYVKNLLHIKNKLFLPSISIKKKKYSNILKTYKLHQSIKISKSKVNKFNLRTNKFNLKLGKISKRLNVYKIIKKKNNFSKYCLWNFKKSILKRYRFIKKKYNKRRILKYFIFRNLVNNQMSSNNLHSFIQKTRKYKKKFTFKCFKRKYLFFYKKLKFRKKIIKNWQNRLKTKIKYNLDFKTLHLFNNKFQLKYNKNITKILFSTFTIRKKKLLLLKYFKISTDQTPVKTTTWQVTTHKPETQSNPLYESFVTNYSDGKLLYREVKNKRFSRTKKKHHNEVKYKFYVVHGVNQHEEIKKMSQKEIAVKIAEIKKIIETQQTELSKPDLTHLRYITFIQLYVPTLKNLIFEEDKKLIINSQLIEAKLDKLKTNKKYFEINLNKLGLKRKNILENQLLNKIFMNKFLSKRLFFNLKYNWTLKRILKNSLFNKLKKNQISKIKILQLLKYSTTLNKNYYKNIRFNINSNKPHNYITKPDSEWNLDLYKIFKSRSYRKKLKKLFFFNRSFSFKQRLNKKNNIKRLTNNNILQLTKIIKQNRLLKINKKYLNFKYKFIKFYCKLKRIKKNYFNIKKIKKNTRSNINYFYNYKKHKNNQFFKFLLQNNIKLNGKLIYINKKNKIKKFNILKKKYKKIKKKWIHFSSKLIINLYYNVNLIKKDIISKSIITNYLWLNNKNYENYLLNFFFFKKQLLKKFLKKKKTFFFNFRNKRLKTYRIARNVHWKSFTNKSLNERRYQNFLNLSLKKQNNFFYNIATIFSFKFRLSYKFWTSISIFYNNYYKTFSLKEKKIFQLPVHIDFWYLLKFYNTYKQKINKKILLWQSKRLRIKKTFWMQQKKKTPKFLKKKIFEAKGLLNTLQYDFITNYFAILKFYKSNTHTNLFIFKNKYLKLHGFKYKS